MAAFKAFADYSPDGSGLGSDFATAQSESQHQIGLMYFEGQGVEVDYKQARVWYDKAAAQDHPGACNGIAQMYWNGWGVASSLRSAREFFVKAAGLGVAGAVETLRRIREEHIPQVPG